MRQIILDTETTGLHPEQGHRIIEVGCVEMINRKLTGKYYHQYINPQREVEEGAFAVHGISNQFLADKPVFATVAVELRNFIQDAELVIHNAPFDVGFLNHEFKLHNPAFTAVTDFCRIIDTLVLAKQLHVGQRNSLDALCKRYEVDNSQRDLHGALLDAHLLAKVYLAMTGGQGSLFEELEERETTSQQTKDKVIVAIERRNLRIVKANVEELQEHEARLQALAKKGKCLWLESMGS
jgi:DNA polymerase-3 subunit epsilon